ncbi:hypothetical protein GQ600_24149 [Phytophthora cactorum]|nr:hypothetical protein GQ600_24149 [Phytophthora cactorum]
MLKDKMDAVVIEKSLQLRDYEIVALQLSSDVFTKIGFGVDLNGLGGDVDVEMEHPFIKAVETFGYVFQSRLQSPMWLWRLKKRFGLAEEGEFERLKRLYTTS